jgi:hypothetical protein
VNPFLRAAASGSGASGQRPRPAPWLVVSLVFWVAVGFTRSRFNPRDWYYLAEPRIFLYELAIQYLIGVAEAFRRGVRVWATVFTLVPVAVALRASIREDVVDPATLAILTLAPGLLALVFADSARRLLSRARARDTRLQVLLAGGFLVVCGWFRGADVWQEHFFEKGGGWLYLANNVFRLLAVAYLLWLHCALGFLVLRGLHRARPASAEAPSGTPTEGALERFVVAFFVGAAVIQATMLVLGLLGLFQRWLLCGAAAAALALAPTEPLDSVRALLATALPRRPAPGRHARLLAGSVAATLLLVHKGLFPRCTGDLVTHYFPYYRAVIANGGLCPNEVWYHYYHTKGAGAIFLGILLTDSLGAQLASCAFFAVSALVIYGLIHGATGKRRWAFLGASIYVAAAALGDGEFEMQHAITMGYASGLVFMAMLLQSRPERRAFLTPVTAALAAAWVLHVPTIAPLVAVVLLFLAVPAAARKDWSLVRSYFATGVGASVAWAVMAVVSYAQTGMVDIVPFRLFWRFADQALMSRWISPYLMVLLEEGSKPELGAVQPLSLRGISWDFWSQAFRLDRIPVLCPHPSLFLALLAVAVAAAKLEGGRRRAATLPLIALGLATLGCGAMNQPQSLLRFSIYLLFVTVSISVLAWSFVAARLSRRRLRWLDRVVPVALALLSVGWAAVQFPSFVAATRWKFLLGTRSYSEAYDQQGVSWDASGYLARTLPPGTRVWSMNVALSMAPTPRLETPISFSMGPRWHEALFEPAERARQILHEEGLDYFWIDTDQCFYDLLAFSPLLGPDQIGQWMRVVWQQDGKYLLTWRNGSTVALPDELLRDYRKQIEESRQVADWKGLYERLRSIYEANRGKSYPLRREAGLPPIRGWQ